MPVTSSTSFVKRWPTAESVLEALRAWAVTEARKRSDLVALGYFGSYARGDSGFGSDLDLVAIVEQHPLPFMERGCDWPTETLPVPTDFVIYTVAEWRKLQEEGGRFAQTLSSEAVWIVGQATVS